MLIASNTRLEAQGPIEVETNARVCMRQGVGENGRFMGSATSTSPMWSFVYTTRNWGMESGTE